MRLFIFLLILCSYNTSAEIYKTLNPDGSTTYSDTETLGSETIIPAKLTTAPAVKVPKKAPALAADEKPLPYKNIAIVSPKNQNSITSTSGNLDITLTVTPPLQKRFQHSITLYQNGKAIKTGLTNSSIQVTNLNRGTHSFTASILNSKQKTLKTSQTITVHIKRHSKLHNKAK